MADADEFVTINSVELALDGTWFIRDPTPLLGQAPFRGDDRAIPGVAGKSGRARVLDAWDVILDLRVYGRKDKDGVAHSNVRNGLRDNLSYLKTNLLTGTTVTCQVTFSDATSVSADCIVNELRVIGSADNRKGLVADCTLDITILDGELT